MLEIPQPEYHYSGREEASDHDDSRIGSNSPPITWLISFIFRRPSISIVCLLLWKQDRKLIFDAHRVFDLGFFVGRRESFVDAVFRLLFFKALSHTVKTLPYWTRIDKNNTPTMRVLDISTGTLLAWVQPGVNISQKKSNYALRHRNFAPAKSFEI